MILGFTDEPEWIKGVFDAGVKLAEAPEVAYNLVGVLQFHNSRIILSVPNALVRGIFSAMREPGIELPEHFSAHIVVMRPEEVTGLGGPDKISERGKQYEYTLGRLYAAESPEPGIAKVWFLRAHSPQLQQLRKSYGLSAFPGNDDSEFHVICALRRRGVLAANAKSKAGAV